MQLQLLPGLNQKEIFQLVSRKIGSHVFFAVALSLSQEGSSLCWQAGRLCSVLCAEILEDKWGVK